MDTPVRRTSKSHVHQLRTDTGYRQENLPRAMTGRKGWYVCMCMCVCEIERERERGREREEE